MVVTICRLYETYPDATRVVRDLEIAGIPSSAISIVSNNSDNWYSAKDATNLNEEAQPAGAAQSRNDVNETTRNTGRADPIDHRQDAAAAGDAESDDRLEGAAIGAAIGGAAGTAAGLVTGLGLLAIRDGYRWCYRRSPGSAYEGWGNRGRCTRLCRGRAAGRHSGCGART